MPTTFETTVIRTVRETNTCETCGAKLPKNSQAVERRNPRGIVCVLCDLKSRKRGVK